MKIKTRPLTKREKILVSVLLVTVTLATVITLTIGIKFPTNQQSNTYTLPNTSVNKFNDSKERDPHIFNPDGSVVSQIVSYPSEPVETPNPNPNYSGYPLSPDKTAKNKVFYIDYIKNADTLSSFDVANGKLESWIDWDRSDKSIMLYANKITSAGVTQDKRYLSYILSQSPVGRIVLVDLETKIATLAEKLEDIEYLSATAFYSPNKYAYVYVDSEMMQRIVLVENGNKKVLSETQLYGYGRGIGDHDSERISFSASGIQLAYNSTFSRADSLEIYNLNSGVKVSVDNATHARWILPTKLVFLRLDWKNEGKFSDHFDGLYTFDIATQTVEKLPNIASPEAYKPQVSSDGAYLAYTAMFDRRSELWVYNLQNKSGKKIAENAYLPLWISNDSLIYEKIVFCKEGESRNECTSNYYYTVGTEVYNLTTNKTSSKVGNVTIPELYLDQAATQFNTSWL